MNERDLSFLGKTRLMKFDAGSELKDPRRDSTGRSKFDTPQHRSGSGLQKLKDP